MTARRRLTDEEQRAWLRLARTENVGPSTFAALMARFIDAREALAAVPRLAHRGGAQALRIPSATDADKELERLHSLKGRLICSCEPDFPPGLAALDPPPPVISVLGEAGLFAREMVAVVGARNASALGIKFASSLSADLGSAGLVIASGLARGIDSAAHKASLLTGTIAVVAGGIDVVYPPENQQLYEDIKEKGALISELPVGMAPLPRHFPRRNRLISGLARGVVVVEAAERSGSLITANYALEQGREVFAVPGSPLDPRAKGSNRLIREGALLTECAEDVLSALRPIIGQFFGETRDTRSGSANLGFPVADAEKDADQIRVLVEEKLGAAPVEIDELIRQCAAPAPAILTVLLELELSGRVQRHLGNRISWR
jgi:DNA processing protein